MKKIFFYSALVIFLASCSQGSDKKAELEKLKQQREAISNKILALESEIGVGTDDNAIKAIPVKVQEATEVVFNHYIQVQGVVDGDQNIAVSPQMAGIVTAVFVKEGSVVKKGQIMAELDDQILKQSIEEVKTQLQLATSVYEKQKSLWDKKIGSELQYLQAKNGKESLEQRINTLKEQLKLSKVISPINGTVESIPLRVGQMASPGMPNSTVRVINMNGAKISADISEAYSASIKKGKTVIVKFPDLNSEIETSINFTSRFIDPVNRTFKVECKLASNDIELRANMIALLKIKDYVNEKAFSLPVNFIMSNQEGRYIYVAKQIANDWIAERKAVKTGIDYDGYVEVLEGINAGDKIIVSGIQGLNQGDKVTF